ncbi:MAG: class I SAM-dependent methyltransferase [Bacteroidales bacterium]
MNLNLRKIYYWLSPKYRFLARRIFYLPSDLVNKFKITDEKLQPPKGMIFTGSGDFTKQGELFLKHFIEYGGLKADDYVLDIGSGIGRMAIPLTNYLSPNARYEGFDIVKKGVDWCKKEITSTYPNFAFTHIDLKNTLYNLNTSTEASDFRFPYSDKYFDFAFLISVFTHMLQADVENYFKEISRVLKPEGICFATFFIVPDSSESINHNKKFTFSYDLGNYLVMDKKVPEANVEYKQSYLKDIFSNFGFEIKSTHLGYWSGRNKSESLDFQDILILKKV